MDSDSARIDKGHPNPRFDTGDQLVSNLGTSLLKGTDRSVSTDEGKENPGCERFYTPTANL